MPNHVSDNVAQCEYQKVIHLMKGEHYAPTKAPPISPFRVGERVLCHRAIGTGVLAIPGRVVEFKLLTVWMFIVEIEYTVNSEVIRQQIICDADELKSLELVPYQIQNETPLPFDELEDWIPPTLFPREIEIMEFASEEAA